MAANRDMVELFVTKDQAELIVESLYNSIGIESERAANGRLATIRKGHADKERRLNEVRQYVASKLS
jgi:hypothetical protein